ncbi:MAG TPA: prevent-host-death protein [Allosphingosinicella sp.]|jgi:antitoxin (DNA-binding transcriptional repressor) of toxin-antitoxin stability system
MGKLVGTAEFKANCSRIMAEALRSGESIVITKRGEPIMELKPIPAKEPKPLFGFLKGMITVHGDIEEPIDPDWEAQWEANNPPELYR